MDATMAFYNEKEQLYLWTDTSGVGFRASLLQVRDGVWFPRNKAPDDAILWLVAFLSNSLTSA